MNGTVAGGWAYVIGAYAVSAIVFGLYAVQTFITFRIRSHKRE
jgi:hypothetical protein